MVGVAGKGRGVVYCFDGEGWSQMFSLSRAPKIIDGNYVVVSRDDGELLE